MMQERDPSSARKPTARRSAERSAQSESAGARFSSPGFIVTTRKIAAFVRGEETDCGTARTAADGWALMGSEAIGIFTCRGRDEITFREVPLTGGISGSDSLPKGGE